MDSPYIRLRNRIIDKSQKYTTSSCSSTSTASSNASACSTSTANAFEHDHANYNQRDSEEKVPFKLVKTIRGAKELMYNGFYYTIDRIGKNNVIQWKCERTCTTKKHAKCNGQG